MLFAQTGLTAINLDVKRQSTERRKTYIFQGLVFAVGGILAAAASILPHITVAVLIGCILLVTGFFQYLVARDLKMHWWAKISAALSVLCGFLILWNPVTGLPIAVTLMTAFFAIEAIVELLLGYQLQFRKAWGWIYLSGAVTFAMAAILAVGYPALGAPALAWVVAINFIPYGSWLLILAAQHSRIGHKKVLMLSIIVVFAATAPVFAQTQDKYALGNMYTKALNVLGSQGKLDTLEPEKHVRISNIHADHGQIILTIIEEGNPSTVMYDMLSGRLIPALQ